MLQALRKIIAARAGRVRSAAPVVLLVWPYLHRVAARFEALVRRGRQGDAAAAPARARPASVAARLRRPRLPRGFAWLIRLAPDAAPLGGQLRHLLADPEFSALLAADPRAGKILRPLCRMLGVSPDPDLPSALFKPLAARASPSLDAQAAPPPMREGPDPRPSPDPREPPHRALFVSTPA